MFQNIKMPKYFYQCKECEKQFNLFHKIKETGFKCIKCGSENLTRLIAFINLEKDNLMPIGGHLTEIIEENKNLLDSLKKELREQH